MKYAGVHRTWLNSEAADAPLDALGAWLRLAVHVADQETGEPTDDALGWARIAGCSEWGDRAWLRSTGLERSEVELAVSANLARWDGDDLLVGGYDYAGQVATQKKRRAGREGGKLGGRPPKSKKNPEPNPKRNPKGYDDENPEAKPIAKPSGEPPSSPSLPSLPFPPEEPNRARAREPAAAAASDLPDIAPPDPRDPVVQFEAEYRRQYSQATAGGAVPPSDKPKLREMANWAVHEATLTSEQVCSMLATAFASPMSRERRFRASHIAYHLDTYLRGEEPDVARAQPLDRTKVGVARPATAEEFEAEADDFDKLMATPAKQGSR